MDNAIKLMIEPKKYQSKPQDVWRINNSIVKYPTEINVEDFANEIINGKTFICSLIDNGGWGLPKRQEKFWKSQQVIALDFDNEIYIKDENGKNKKIKHISVTLEQILQDKFIKKYAAFAYNTFSNKIDHPKFRIVFVFDTPFSQLAECKKVINQLLKLYPSADQQCSDGVRLFYGGSNLQIINYSNRLPNDPTLWEDIKGINLIYPTKGSGNSINTTNIINIHNYQSSNSNNQIIHKSNKLNSKLATNLSHIQAKDIQLLINSINPEPVTLHNNHQVFDYLKQQDLRVFLGVDSNHIYDIFHDEDKPSSSLYQSESGTGHWLYKCHSTSASFVGTILQITEKLLGCSLQEVKEFLMQVYKITIVENETQKRLKEEIDNYKYILQTEELPELYPNFYKLFNGNGYLEDLYILLDLVKENLSADSDDPRMLFYHSINTIAKRFMRSTSNTSVRINFLTFFKLIYKLDESDVPKYILDRHIQNKISKKYKYLNNTYELKTYEYSFFSELDSRCDEWMSKGLTTKTMNYEGILRNFGQEEANRVFPQDKDKQISELHEDVVSLIESTTMKIISDKGWSTEKEILENVKLYFKGQKKLKEELMKRCIGEMLDKYNLERISCNKDVKKEMEITEEQLPLVSFPKLIRPKK
jgi:hypothetical protein